MARAWIVITMCGGQGWVCYPAVQDRAGFVIPLSEQGWVCYPAAGAGLGLLSRCCWSTSDFDRDCVVETGLGLLSRCRSRAGFVIPLLEQGWVCYPAAVGLALIAIVWLRQGWVCYPAVGAGLLRYINFRLGHTGSGVIQKTHFSIRSRCFFFIFTKKTLR